MSVYQTSSGFGVDWRDEFNRRHRKFVGSREAALRMDQILREQVAVLRGAARNFRAANVNGS